jgi:hypothetical protein
VLGGRLNGVQPVLRINCVGFHRLNVAPGSRTGRLGIYSRRERAHRPGYLATLRGASGRWLVEVISQRQGKGGSEQGNLGGLLAPKVENAQPFRGGLDG